ncbi:PTS sugar transporter subunit IIC [Atopobacter sp. AH10]|uniref:PTS mannose/fructose/sorbose/N-acetylgalactosamine transporter subunit IIC n=1 Tax=Atopobacter sp. AH10 TaxID=2315861 RepID=UPI000EF1B049|nr:PTS sugar transporter subunit IIC [Atopobacter sp. AH10]RLK62839.1 PTS sugar transporter subunit IIC [Atopobacter sp. AH10]
MEIQIWQIIVLSLLGGFAIVENLSTCVLANQALMMGTITGIVMGDLKTGLAVGATLQLMGLGIQAYGGASVPDYMTASIVGTAFAVSSGKGIEFGIGLAVPVALLMIQLDILARFGNVFLQRQIDNAIKEKKEYLISRYHYLGILNWGLSRALPIFIVFCFGQRVVDLISHTIPSWLTGGLSVAGGILPAVGIAILLRYLPAKNYLTFLIIGFLAVAYLKMSVFGVALLGLACALYAFQQAIKSSENTSYISESESSMGKGLLNDEYEN